MLWDVPTDASRVPEGCMAPIVWPHVANVAVVSYTSNMFQHDFGSYLGMYILLAGPGYFQPDHNCSYTPVITWPTLLNGLRSGL